MKTVAAILSAVLSIGGGFSAQAEIVERELGTDARGNQVTGYVFQAGRSFRGTSSLSSLRPRRVYRPGRSRGIVRSGFGMPYWYGPIVPFHCVGPGYGWGGGHVSIWRGGVSRVSVSISR